MHVHRLDKSKHKHFLSEGRIDPITGEKILAGDEIVICAACKSAFLRETWEYLGKQHCRQKHTVAEVPTSNALSLRKRNPLGTVRYKSVASSFVGLPRGLGSQTVILGLALPLFGFFMYLGAVVSSAFFSIVGPVLLGLILMIQRFQKPNLHIREDGIEVLERKKLKRIRFEEVERLHLHMNNDPLNNSTVGAGRRIRLNVLLKSGTSFWVGISDNPLDSRKISRIIFELHPKVKVSFAVKDQGDYKRLNRIAREANADVKVTQL
ncbi:MAG: hypothetical protein AAF740_03510 [Bacteroidota bacterium]